MAFHCNQLKNLICVFIIAIAFPGCFQHYYKASEPAYSNHAEKASVIDTLRKQGKYFILRNGSHAYHMKDISLSPDNKTMKTTLDTLPYDHMMYLTKDRNGIMKYIKNNHSDIKVLSEVHVYIAPDSGITTGNYVLPPDNIQKIELIEPNNARTTTSMLLGFGIVACIFIGLVAIVASSNLFLFE